MRKQPTLLLLLSTLLLFSWGCGQSEESAAPPSPPPAPTSGTTPPAPPPQAGTPAAAPEAATKPSADLKSFGLIPATNPKQRQQQIAAGRSNPFALIAIQPKVEPGIPAVKVMVKKPTKPTSSTQQAKSGKSNPSGSTVIAIKPNNGQVKVTTKGQGKKTWNSAKPIPPQTIAKALPPAPPPPPTEAKGVEISGVIAIGNTPFAIIQAPGESVPRYVSPGDSIANGQVRVVSINNNSETPTVTLEQYGQKVIREVGAPPEGSVVPAPPGSAPSQPTAS